MTTNNYVNLTESKFISICGDDTKDFLQGIITNDINKCSEKKPIYSCLLTPQGKFISDFFIIKRNKDYLIEINKNFKDQFLDKINIYKLRSKIIINEVIDLVSIVCLSSDILINNEIISFSDPRDFKLGKKIFLHKNQINDFVKKFNLNEVSLDIYKELLIINLIPSSADDLEINKSLLLENNFQNINAIDWDKGCYVGQEMTARMNYRSLLKKRIYNLQIISGKINVGDEIKVNQIVLGKVISKVNKYIICMLKIDLVSKKSKNKESIDVNDSAVLKFL